MNNFNKQTAPVSTFSLSFFAKAQFVLNTISIFRYECQFLYNHINNDCICVDEMTITVSVTPVRPMWFINGHLSLCGLNSIYMVERSLHCICEFQQIELTTQNPLPNDMNAF